MMNTNARGLTKYEHTPQIVTRRRSLFPSDNSSVEDSDLGHISPLSIDSDEDIKHLTEIGHQTEIIQRLDTIGTCDLPSTVEVEQQVILTPLNKNRADSETMSPLCLSPHYNTRHLFNETTVVETPSKISPSFRHKTPHDTSNNTTKVPKLIRKSLLDSSDIQSNKRKFSSLNSPEANKKLKLDPKNSKVRTTLFPTDDMSLPTIKFYPKPDTGMETLISRNAKKLLPLPNVSHVPRRSKPRKRKGEINAGVRHNIRKPKQAKSTRTITPKRAIMFMKNDPINEYIQDIKELQTTQSVRLIEHKENTNPKLLDATPKTKTCMSNKQTRSPRAEEHNPNKKFFKSSRNDRNAVTMSDIMKDPVDHAKSNLLEQNEPRDGPNTRIDFDINDFTVEETPMINTNIDSILSSLEEDCTENTLENASKSNQIVLYAHNSVLASENSILLHADSSSSAANMILSPISQMCDVTSGLALNSPKKAKNLTAILENMPSSGSTLNEAANEENTNPELFPIFYAPKDGIYEKKEVTPKKKCKKVSRDQLLLDAGQKRFGATQCLGCGIVYHMGDPSDEDMHFKHHHAVNICRFGGWKNERIVADLQNNGRIIQLIPGDSKIWWKKAADLMTFINREIGCCDIEFLLEGSQVFLYIKNKSIVGCLVALSKSEGHIMLTTNTTQDFCSEKIYPIQCGVARIWVSSKHRKQGIATAMMDALKNNFSFGSILRNVDIAMSTPTEMGKQFSRRYFETPNFMVYYI